MPQPPLIVDATTSARAMYWINPADPSTPIPPGTQSSPEFHRTVGGSNIATNQAASSISPAAATQIVAARAGRQSVILTNITGTQPVYIVASGVTTGATTGHFLAGTAGASITISTAAAIFATSPTAAQTISFLENY